MSEEWIKVVRFDESRLKRYNTMDEQNAIWLDICIPAPPMSVSFEEFRAEAQMKIPWVFMAPEVQYVLEGKAEITYTVPPWHDSSNKRTITLQKGDVYLIPKGTRWMRKVISKEPFRHICVGTE